MSVGQDLWGAKPDSVKFFTVVDQDTIESHFDTLKPASFTFIRTYYYPHKTRTFKEISGHYLNEQRFGEWIWYLPPIFPKSDECCQVGPIFYVHFMSDSLSIEHVIGKDMIVKHYRTGNLSGTIYPKELKSTRFVMADGTCEFFDLSKNEIRYGHYSYLEDLIFWYEVETKIELMPTQHNSR
jgi:hypothetical protein